MWFLKRDTSEVDPAREEEKQGKLVEAENRANRVYDRAEWLRAVVTRRDSQNHWQESVNRLLSGGHS